MFYKKGGTFMKEEMKLTGAAELDDTMLDNVVGGANAQPVYDEKTGKIICPDCGEYMEPAVEMSTGICKCNRCGFEYDVYGVSICPIL